MKNLIYFFLLSYEFKIYSTMFNTMIIDDLINISSSPRNVDGMFKILGTCKRMKKNARSYKTVALTVTGLVFLVANFIHFA